MRSLRSFTLATAATVLVLACGGDHNGPTEPPPPPPPTLGMKIVAGASVTDTIGTQVPQALTVEVRDSAGALAVGTVVRFTSVPVKTGSTTAYGVLLTAVNQNQYTSFAGPSTDASGRAAVLVQLGTVAGPARIAISVPTLGLVDTVSYTVQPGAAAKLAAAFADTGVVVGTKVPVGISIVDRAGNPRTDPVTFDAPSDPSVASVSPAGVITALAVGHTTITGHVGTATATTAVEVVPDAQIIVYSSYGGEVGTIHLDGSGYTKLGSFVGWDGSGLSMRPDGAIIYSSGGQLYAMSAAGTSTPLDAAGTPGAANASWPEYNAAAKATFYSAMTASTGQIRLWKLGDDGTHTPIDAEPAANLEWRPAVSPDGTKLAYITVANNAASIKVYDMAAGTTSSWSVVGQDPRWSPNGDEIVFTQSGYGQLKVMNADGTNVRVIGSGTYSEYKPDWSPDGKFVIAKSNSGSIDLIDPVKGTTMKLPYLSTYSAMLWKH